MNDRMQKIWRLVSDLNENQVRLFDTGEYKIYVNVSESPRMLMRAVGEHEPNKSELIRRLLAAGDVFVDVGASFGGSTLLAATLVGPAGRVYAFEANPDNAECLKRSVRENGCENVEVSISALSNEEGTARLSLAEKSDQHSIVTKSSRFLEVPASTLDNFVAARNLDRLSLMNVDVEGAEHLVLEGGKQAIERFKPYLLLTHHPRQSPNARMVGRQLGALGYKFADVRAPDAALDNFPLDPCNICAWPAEGRAEPGSLG